MDPTENAPADWRRVVDPALVGRLLRRGEQGGVIVTRNGRDIAGRLTRPAAGPPLMQDIGRRWCPAGATAATAAPVVYAKGFVTRPAHGADAGPTADGGAGVAQRPLVRAAAAVQRTAAATPSGARAADAASPVLPAPSPDAVVPRPSPEAPPARAPAGRGVDGGRQPSPPVATTVAAPAGGRVTDGPRAPSAPGIATPPGLVGEPGPGLPLAGERRETGSPGPGSAPVQTAPRQPAGHGGRSGDTSGVAGRPTGRVSLSRVPGGGVSSTVMPAASRDSGAAPHAAPGPAGSLPSAGAQGEDAPSAPAATAPPAAVVTPDASVRPGPGPAGPLPVVRAQRVSVQLASVRGTGSAQAGGDPLAPGTFQRRDPASPVAEGMAPVLRPARRRPLVRVAVRAPARPPVVPASPAADSRPVSARPLVRALDAPGPASGEGRGPLPLAPGGASGPAPAGARRGGGPSPGGFPGGIGPAAGGGPGQAPVAQRREAVPAPCPVVARAVTEPVIRRQPVAGVGADTDPVPDEADPDALTERQFQRLVRRIAVENERRGGVRWP